MPNGIIFSSLIIPGIYRHDDFSHRSVYHFVTNLQVSLTSIKIMKTVWYFTGTADKPLFPGDSNRHPQTPEQPIKVLNTQISKRS